MAGVVAVWWGAQKGGVAGARHADRRPTRFEPPGAAHRHQGGGRRPGKHRANIVFPDPGGPDNRRWCPPAAAISSARRAISLPAHLGEIYLGLRADGLAEPALVPPGLSPSATEIASASD